MPWKEEWSSRLKASDLQKFQGLGMTIGAALMDVKKATTLASITLMTFMLSGGFFIQVRPPKNYANPLIETETKQY